MGEVCNERHSNLELLGRNVVYPFSFKGSSDEIKPGLFYPKKRKDEDRQDFFTNKISMVRLCRCHTESFDIDIDRHVSIASSFFKLDKNGDMPQLRGFKIDFVKNFLATGILELELAASERNPYHTHLVIKNYDHLYDDRVSSVSQLLSQSQKMILDRLQRETFYFTLLDEISLCKCCEKLR